MKLDRLDEVHLFNINKIDCSLRSSRRRSVVGFTTRWPCVKADRSARCTCSSTDASPPTRRRRWRAAPWPRWRSVVEASICCTSARALPAKSTICAFATWRGTTPPACAATCTAARRLPSRRCCSPTRSTRRSPPTCLTRVRTKA